MGSEREVKGARRLQVLKAMARVTENTPQAVFWRTNADFSHNTEEQGLFFFLSFFFSMETLAEPGCSQIKPADLIMAFSPLLFVFLTDILPVFLFFSSFKQHMGIIC